MSYDEKWINEGYKEYANPCLYSNYEINSETGELYSLLYLGGFGIYEKNGEILKTEYGYSPFPSKRKKTTIDNCYCLVDESVSEIISNLNKSGYKTKASCSGSSYDHYSQKRIKHKYADNICSPYISFNIYDINKREKIKRIVENNDFLNSVIYIIDEKDLFSLYFDGSKYIHKEIEEYDNDVLRFWSLIEEELI